MSSHKIRDRAEAARWRRGIEGIVVFTNGVFDLLHPGHVKLLEDARALGQALIVGINDDQSATKLGKGPRRPVNSAADRARVVAALEAVDCVVIFQEDTPESLVRELEPDILVKGSDYRETELPGRLVVEEWGGKVILIDLLPGHSTTAIIQRIRGAS